MSLLASMKERRTAVQGEIDALLDTVETDKRTALTDEESAAFAELTKERDALNKRIPELEELETSRAAEAAAQKRAQAVTNDTGQPVAHILSEPQVYGKGSGHSYFMDLLRDQLRRGDGDGGPGSAGERLRRHAAEIDVELPRRERLRAERAATEMRSLGEASAFERRTNPNRTDGQGGYFVPPLWLVDEYVPLARASRVFANTVRQLTLPGGTDSISVPKVATGTATAAQTADAASVTSTDLTDTSVTVPVRTIAGQQDIALQLLDQSPISFDEVVFGDLMADYAARLDIQCLDGTGSNGQATGISQVSSIVAVTYTDASPTGPEMYPNLAAVVSQIATGRFLPPTAWFMHPRRWYWLMSQLDSTNRPLVVPAQNAYNPAALQTGVVAEGPAGMLMGLPVFLDANIKTTLGGGTEDIAFAVRTPDVYLWEGAMRSRTLTEVLSGTLQVRLQVYNYFAFMAGRYPKAIGTVGGTGFAAPSGF